ncbi:hypothetical protein SAMN05216276_1001159 [Streptosporangium subroseum]|uniref:Uncharacterized protein n=1 Tax=Streptosporangium subroseum TaxID=106412 RepID=A0A239A6A9_9ACTN|nr:hypothetical protein SAMN05216276_1001159 [Streptosporangium subroseum]
MIVKTDYGVLSRFLVNSVDFDDHATATWQREKKSMRRRGGGPVRSTAPGHRSIMEA